VNCQETQPLLHGYVDGELDLTTTLALEQHLRQCPACAGEHSALRTLRSTLADGALYFQPPPNLRSRVRAAVRRTRPRPYPWRWLAVAASLAFVALTVWGVLRLVAVRADDLLTRELVASHVRSQMPVKNHRFDVEPPDQHTAKPWFEDKLDFAPPVYALTDQGYDLIGGRLDYLNDRAVAALVYQRHKHHISLYVWPSPDAASAPATSTRRGFQLIHWQEGGLTYWAVSDLNESELRQFVQLIQERAR